ncbi:MAG TPA: tRNA pseudouridine(55) synthase TruB [Beutenbergiaceae bacterium]|nr:tRNA pseudouridine(55) synthase TruB [Beutenbergiaceae bacterium]
MTTSDGLLLVDKPAGMTSHDVVNRVRRAARTRRVGHAGTLDPMATGLLVLGVGRATRLLTYLVGADKTYHATIRLGQTTHTDDAQGDLIESRGARVESEAITPHVEAMTGAIQQVPSAVSAIKVDGQRAYTRVRAGEDVKLAPRSVTIHEFLVTSVAHNQAADATPVTDIEATIRCSSGTYIRAIARDLGHALSTGGHLWQLRRSHVGPFSIDQAGPCPQEGDDLVGSPAFMTLDQALMAAFPIRVATEVETRALSYGQQITESAMNDVVGVLSPQGQAVALVKNKEGRAAPVIVFTPS